MKHNLKQIGCFLRADAEMAEVLQLANRVLDGPLAFEAMQGPATLCRRARAVGPMSADHLDAALAQHGVEGGDIADFFADQALGWHRAGHEIAGSLHKIALLRRCVRAAGRYGQAGGVDCLHDFHSAAKLRGVDAIAALTGFLEARVDQAFAEQPSCPSTQCPTARINWSKTPPRVQRKR